MRLIIINEDGSTDRRDFPDGSEIKESLTITKPDGSGSFTLRNIQSWREMTAEELAEEEEQNARRLEAEAEAHKAAVAARKR